MSNKPIQTIELQITADDKRIATLAAYAIGLHMVEAVLPSPIPGVKPGIANIITLYVLYQYGIKTAIWVSLLRIFASSLLLGQFLSPTFFLSLTGGVLSLLVLACTAQLPQRYFGPVTLSILSAVAHIAGQLLLVSVWLIPHAGISYLIPIFFLAALVFGLINGIITQKLMH